MLLVSSSAARSTSATASQACFVGILIFLLLDQVLQELFKGREYRPSLRRRLLRMVDWHTHNRFLTSREMRNTIETPHVVFVFAWVLIAGHQRVKANFSRLFYACLRDLLAINNLGKPLYWAYKLSLD